MKRTFALLSALGLMISSAAAEEDGIMAKMEKMTLREKVGQLFMIRPDSLEERFGPAELEDNNRTGTTRVTDEMRERYAEYPCGGFALFRKNILAPSQLRGFAENLHQIGEIPPLLAIDEEGGRIARIANHPTSFGVKKFPTMAEIGAAGDPAQAYTLGKTIGDYLTAFGLDIDFAPVADVNTNPQNVVIGDRAFGEDPEKAAEMVAQVVAGLHDGGVLSCVKHFPGHGDTAADTHTGYAETLKTWEEIAACEMIPFRAGIVAGTELIMTAHIAAPNVTGGQEPASVSYLLLTEKLRQELGFQGVIITDALAMGAIHEHYSSAEASVAALQAGADILLMPYNYYEAFDGVMQAVAEGVLSEERIDESVYRVLKLKEGRFGE
ncbi:MAG: glycoside hydrolase [Clostridia bacterium]|nr:glycoside hydrolase [Clostridia bacterium]